MKNFFKTLTIIFTVFVLSAGFFGVVNAASDLFGCKGLPSGGVIIDCSADSVTADCGLGKVVDETYCHRFDNNRSLCNGARAECITYVPASRDNSNGGGNIISLPNPLASDNFEDFITSLIRSLTVIASPILVLMIVWGGFTFVVSGGKPEKAKKGRDIIKYAIIGFAIIVFAWIIVAILRGIL